MVEETVLTFQRNRYLHLLIQFKDLKIQCNLITIKNTKITQNLSVTSFFSLNLTKSLLLLVYFYNLQANWILQPSRNKKQVKGRVEKAVETIGGIWIFSGVGRESLFVTQEIDSPLCFREAGNNPFMFFNVQKIIGDEVKCRIVCICMEM